MLRGCIVLHKECALCFWINGKHFYEAFIHLFICSIVFHVAWNCKYLFICKNDILLLLFFLRWVIWFNELINFRTFFVIFKNNQKQFTQKKMIKFYCFCFLLIGPSTFWKPYDCKLDKSMSFPPDLDAFSGGGGIWISDSIGSEEWNDGTWPESLSFILFAIVDGSLLRWCKELQKWDLIWSVSKQ